MVWPLDGISKSVFGHEFGVFDDLRVRYHARITYDESLSAFKITSEEAPNLIPRAVNSLKVALSEQLVLNTPCLRLYLIDLPEKLSTYAHVELQAGDSTQASCYAAGLDHHVEIVPRLVEHQLGELLHGLPEHQNTDMKRRNMRCMEVAVEQMLMRMLYLRRRLRLRALLGVFIFKKILRPATITDALTTERFVRNMQESGTEGSLYRV